MSYEILVNTHKPYITDILISPEEGAWLCKLKQY